MHLVAEDAVELQRPHDRGIEGRRHRGRIEDHVVAPHVGFPRVHHHDGVLDRLFGVRREGDPVDRLPPVAARPERFRAAGAEIHAVFRDHLGAVLVPEAMEALGDVGSLGRREDDIGLAEQEVGETGDSGDTHRLAGVHDRFVRRDLKFELVLDRVVPGVEVDRGLPLAVGDYGGRRELQRALLAPRIQRRLPHRDLRHPGGLFLRDDRRRREAPCPVHEHADPEVERTGDQLREHLPVLHDGPAARAARDAHVRVAGSRGPGGVERGHRDRAHVGVLQERPEGPVAARCLVGVDQERGIEAEEPGCREGRARANEVPAGPGHVTILPCGVPLKPSHSM